MIAFGIIILSISLLLQSVAAFLAFRLIRVTGKRKGWILISIAIFFMVIRRLVPLLHLIFGAHSNFPDLINELFGLLLSTLMVAGAAWIAPLFMSIKRSEEAAKESRKWLLTTLNSIGDAVIATDTHGYITLINPIARSLTGWKEEAIGRPLKEVFTIIDGQTTKLREDTSNDFIQKDRLKLINHTILVTKNGAKLSIEHSAAPIKDDNANVIGAVIVFRDITERKEAEEAIKLAHREINQIFNTAADGMRVIDKDFNVVRINERFSALVGIGKEEIVGQKCSTIFPGSYCHTSNCSMRRILAGEDYLEYDVDKMRKNGEKITCIMTATPLRRSDGELIGIVENFKDITERKRTEELLRRAKMVVENSPTVLFRWKTEEDWPVEFVSENVAQFGYNPAELLSGTVPYTSIIYHEDRDKVIKEINQYFQLGYTHFQQEYRIITREGTIRWVDARTVAEYGSDGQLAHCQGIVIDITERRQVEEAVRQSEIAKAERQRLFAVLDVLPAIVYLQSPTYSIPFANRRFREIFGDPQGKPCYEIIHGLKEACRECRICPVLEKKEPSKWALITSDSRTYEIYDSLFNDLDNSLLILELGIDITDRLQMEKARDEAERQLKEQRARAILSDHLRSLGELATGIAHELNQPLLGVRGLAEHIILGLKRGWNMPEETIKEKIQLIIDQTDRMSHVIEHTRMFARGADRHELFSVHVNEVIKSSLGLIGAQLRYRGLILNCDLENDIPPVLANPFSLEEVILNLINNARDAVMEIKDIDHHDQAKNFPQIIIHTFKETREHASVVIIEVIDLGAGIPPDLMSKVFDPFFTTKGPDKGTGLGLAISKSIIESFHGSIDLKSAPGSGTTVTHNLACHKGKIKNNTYTL